MDIFKFLKPVLIKILLRGHDVVNVANKMSLIANSLNK